ncbi:MAG: hypothetical protein CSA62_13365 [Planctomycetota bacterium]|nr:MAG: hypothetical protein CSA62_13365 [Planctomycetota bacterium]
MSSILEILGLQATEESLDYIQNKGQFHLFTLLTEQRHPATMQLGYDARDDLRRALTQVLSVDADIVQRFEALAAEPEGLERLVAAFAAAIREGRRMYFYGCGATGRLAKQMESSFWRPFWRRARASSVWERVAALLPRAPEGQLVGEMTGADRALVASLEGFEDLQLLGALQLADHGIEPGDVVVCVTEGGETSSVIGTVLAAREAWGADSDGARQRLFFIYNNPDDVLRPFERSVRVLDEPGITKLCLATGPQALAGSTRMQATTSETYLLGVLLEQAMDEVLRPELGDAGMAALGFGPARSASARLLDFAQLHQATLEVVAELEPLTRLEAKAYQDGRFADYCASAALVTVFTDCTERSPTFRLYALDEAQLQPRRSWVKVCTEGEDAAAAWRSFLGRGFRGLSRSYYEQPLREGVSDPYLRKAALESLARAGDEQEAKYDFSLGAPAKAGLGEGDLAVVVTVGEEQRRLSEPGTVQRRFLDRAEAGGAETFVLHVQLAGAGELSEAPGLALALPFDEDPLEVRQHIGLKVLLNAHSTCTMARLGRVVGNTMTNVSPSNLKLVGRATFLIESHVADVFRAQGLGDPPSFAECNAVLYDAMAWTAAQEPGQTAEVALSIVRIVEAGRRQVALTWEEAAAQLGESGLAEYLATR